MALGFLACMFISVHWPDKRRPFSEFLEDLTAAEWVLESFALFNRATWSKLIGLEILSSLDKTLTSFRDSLHNRSSFRVPHQFAFGARFLGSIAPMLGIVQAVRFGRGDFGGVL